MFLSHQGAWVSAEHLAVDAEQILHVSKGCDSCNSCWSTIHCWGVALIPEPSQNGLGTRLIKMQWCVNILWECATQSRDCTNFQIAQNIQIENTSYNGYYSSRVFKINYILCCLECEVYTVIFSITVCEYTKGLFHWHIHGLNIQQ